MSESVKPDPLWRQVWNFPITAMLVALALVIATIAGSGAALKGLPSVLSNDWALAIQATVPVLAVFALCKLVLRRLGTHKHDVLPLPGAVRWLGLGIGSGAGLMAIVVGIAALVGSYRVIGLGNGEDAVLILFGGGLAASFIEEVLFRGILFRWIEEFAGSWAALGLTAALFGLAHYGNDNGTLFAALAIALEAGVLLGAAYMVTRSLWLPIGIHFGWNVAQGLVFDVPVSGHPVRGLVEAKLEGPAWLSGGDFGLEASAVAMVVATLAGVLMLRRALANRQVVAPMWRR